MSKLSWLLLNGPLGSVGTSCPPTQNHLIWTHDEPAGSSGNAGFVWVQDFSGQTFPADGFVLRRVDLTGAVAATVMTPGYFGPAGSLGVRSVNVATDPAGNAALVGSYYGLTSTQPMVWVQVFGP
jgi:hypothetical protein